MTKRVTIYDIAKELGVSTATVNRAMNNKPGVSEATRQKVVKVANAMGFTVNHIAKSLARPTIRLGFLIYNHIPVYHDEITAGVQREIDTLKDFNVSCRVYSISGPEFEAQQAYNQCLQQQLEDRPDGFLLLGSSQTSELYTYVQQMCKKGIRVGLIDSDLPGSGRLFSCHQNAVMAGRMAAELLSLMVPNGKVAIFTGHKNYPNHMDAVNGFQSECILRGLTLLSVCENHDDPDFAAYNTEKILKQHPDLQGLYISTANSVSVCEKLKQIGYAGRIRIIASDVFHDLVQLMNEDIIQATIFQDPFHQGRKAMRQLYRSVSDNKTESDDILIRPQIILKSNLSDYLYYEKKEESPESLS